MILSFEERPADSPDGATVRLKLAAERNYRTLMNHASFDTRLTWAEWDSLSAAGKCKAVEEAVRWWLFLNIDTDWEVTA